MVKALIFDWGDTIMVDYELPGPMYLWEKVDWTPGADQALASLSSRYTCCIATNAPVSGTAEMIKALQRIGADKYFRFFFSSKDLGYAKPDKRFFLTIAERIGIPVSACVMIGNLYDKDIIGAKEAGMKTVLLNNAKGSGSFPMADFVIDNMEKLPLIIDQL